MDATAKRRLQNCRDPCKWICVQQYIISAFIWEIHGLNVRIYAPVHSQGNNSCKPQRPSPREGVMDLFDKQKGNQTVLV